MIADLLLEEELDDCLNQVYHLGNRIAVWNLNRWVYSLAIIYSYQG